ncbi:DUF2442 domain-containing protein [Mucilaginibacter phyllosphaerae]|uniref:DUF2442 domain-containing protein n=1 Tax=Mucilaginibacter phyllosphaerae TaxID=1812349 RepID=A0A4Y8A9A5_9SPHI|nr:DUF2442 domain-containing protein [Mucilaginibacter phyllosphaerae]MBB3969638.1 hypothetical protein [Mucilaginibacter phyllosphaerae]TEW65024.1 DUF2442 domain-containing protein [Mucilaginibacter phyllosphaerae]GGH18462.1 hypothetical protein GCM10007352_29190 [Mucilaginibacter phyllosphaerae]
MKIIQDYIETEHTDVIEILLAKYVKDYSIRIFFNDGSEKIIDFKIFLTRSLHPSISKYLDIELFKQFSVSNGNLNWNNYDLMFPIHDLYEGVIK